MRASYREYEMKPLSRGGEPDRLWHVIHTKSRQEKALAGDLDRGGIEHFLPLVRKVRYYGRRKCSADLPLFPGYLFLRGTIEQAWSAERTGRVARLIPVVEQDQLDAELTNLRLALDLGAPLTPHDPLARGVWVEVKAGPFRGLRGVVESSSRMDRLVLQVDMLGRAADLEIERSLLEPIGD